MIKEAYKNDGYFVARGLLSLDKIERLKSSIAKSVRDQLRACGIDAPANEYLFDLLKCLHGVDIDRYKKLLGSLWRKLDITEVSQGAEIVEFFRTEFGWNDVFLPGGQVVLAMADDLKIPGGYFGFVTHQDFPSVQGSLDGVVTWFPLFEVTRHNYPLEVIPGSHMRGTLPTVKHGESTWEISPDAYDASQFVPVEVSPGDVIFMSVFTIHRSSLAGGPGKFRLAISSRFDNGDEATFVERGYPSAYIRSVHREQIHTEFPKPEQVVEAIGRL